MSIKDDWNNRMTKKEKLRFLSGLSPEDKQNDRLTTKQYAKKVLRDFHSIGVDKEVKAKDFDGVWGEQNATLYLKNTGMDRTKDNKTKYAYSTNRRGQYYEVRSHPRKINGKTVRVKSHKRKVPSVRDKVRCLR